MVTHFAVRDSDVVPLVFIGVQEWDGHTSQRLFNVKQDMKGFELTHPINSTLSETTITSYGYEIK